MTFLFIGMLTASVCAQITLHDQDFNFGMGAWSAIDLSDPTDVWAINSGYAQINGFGGGNDEDWLISPPIDLELSEGEYLLFDYHDNYAGDSIEVLYSGDFSGLMTPVEIGLATWTSLPLELIDINASACFSTLFQRHPAIDISHLSGTLFFAFRYQGSSSSAKQYRIDNIHIEADHYQGIETSLAIGVRCAELKTELAHLTRNAEDRIRYSSSLYDVWDAFLHTDDRDNDAGNAMIVWDMFTDIPTNTGEFEFDHCLNRDNGTCPGGEGVCYNREHTFPRSWWGSGTTLSDSIYTDLHHICPSDRQLNSIKSNYPPGDVETATSTGSNGFVVGTNSSYPCPGARYFEPIDEFKGDYARMYFYVATRYENYMTGWETLNSYGDCAMAGNPYPAYEPWMIQVLLEWHALDPVDQKEIDRNNAIYAIQGNRNPFIDNPNYVKLVWGDEIGTPCGMVPLPIELAYLRAIPSGLSARIEWLTLSEINNDHFTVERSVDGSEWHSIGLVQGAGNSATEISYSLVDLQPIKGQSYYRLKQTDYDGQYSYSDPVSLNFAYTLDDLIEIYPNPVKDLLTLRGSMETLYDLEIFSIRGVSISLADHVTKVEAGMIHLDLSDLVADVYVIRYGALSKRFIKL